MEKLLSQSFIDFKDDFEELIYLYNDCLTKLSKFSKEIKSNNKYINSYEDLLKVSADYQKDLKLNIKNLKMDLSKINKYKTIKDIEFLQDKKTEYYNSLRIKIGLYASLITSTDWQSPSFNHSLYSMAGRQTGKIIHTISDYKRDIHLDEAPYEKAFLKEYIEAFFKLTTYTYVVNSGMAAFNTVLTFLVTENKIKDKILIGKSIYFQNKEIIEKSFPKKIIEVDDNNDEEIIKKIKENLPSVIILDSICNSFDIAMPNLTKIINYLVKTVKKDTYLVIDSTSLPVYYQPLKLIKGKNKYLNLIIFESLNKYHQFGMDRTTGGVIVAHGKDTIKLYYSRQNSGTNISDVSVHMLPTPNKIFMKKRLLRFKRNTDILAKGIQKSINQNSKLSVDQVIYPGLSNHPAYRWNNDIKFYGSYFCLKFKKGKNNPKNYNKFIKKVIENAKKENIQISVGTSFGFNNTRIYLTSLKSDYGTPFIRISVGTENIIQIEKIKKVFINTMASF